MREPQRELRSTLLGRDVVRLGTTGLQARPMRAILSALGIAIGIAAMIAVVGISASSQAKLNQQLTSLGTNLLTAEAGKTMFGQETRLPPNTVAKVRMIDGVEKASSIAFLDAGALIGTPIAEKLFGIGVANTMIISVLERRREIGLRRALGATRGHIRSQFLAEALLLSASGGILGAILSAGVTAAIAFGNGWPIALPPEALGIAVGATLLIGAVAGLYPAIRAARTPPTAALNG